MRKIGLDISVLNDQKKTGIAVYTEELIKALLKINQKDQFILFGLTTFSTFNYLQNLNFKDYPNVKMKIFKWPAKFFRISFLLWQKINWPTIEDLIGSVDLFHSFNWYFPPQRFGKKVATVFDLTSITHPEWHDKRTTELDIIRMKRIAQFADLTIAISDNSKKDFLSFKPKGLVEVIYPAVSSDFSEKININKANDVFKKYHLKSGYFLSVSTLEPRKNIANLIKAYLSMNTDKSLVLVGKIGWKSEEILNLANKYPEKIKILNFVSQEDLKNLYKNALCLVYPSFYEGFGIPVLESLTLGTPVICSQTSSLPEVGGLAVYYIDPNNINSIKEALIKLSQDKNLCKDLIKKGYSQAKKFSWENSAKKLNSLYEQILNQP